MCACHRPITWAVRRDSSLASDFIFSFVNVQLLPIGDIGKAFIACLVNVL